MKRLRLVVVSLLISMLAFPLLTTTAQEEPEAKFTYWPDDPYVDETVTFDASQSTGNITSYQWDFGDDSIGFGMIVNHTYTEVGTYTVALNITGTEGLWDTESKNVDVVDPAQEPEEPEEPEAAFTYEPAEIYVNDTVTFDASESTANGGEIVSYEWDFGDGTTITETDPITTHAYTAVGTYLVTLNVTDNGGLWAIESEDVDVLGQKYVVTLTVKSVVTGETYFSRTFKGEEEDTTIEIPKDLYESIVTQFGANTFTTPFSVTIFSAISNQVLNFTVTSEPPGLTINYESEDNGDLNSDDIVDIFDMVTVAIAFGSTIGAPNYDLLADLDFDFDIDIFDVVLVATKFGNIYYYATVTVEGTIALDVEIEEDTPNYLVTVPPTNFTASILSDTIPGGIAPGVYDASFEGEADVSDVEIWFIGEEITIGEYEFWAIFKIGNTYSDLPLGKYDAEGELSVTITAGENPTGQLVVNVKDAPASLDELFLSIDGVQVHRQGWGNETWKNITVFTTEPFDLLKLNETSAVLATGELPVGNYTEIRFHIAGAWATINGTTNQPLEITCGWVMVKFNFTIEEAPVTEIVIDIEVNPEPIISARILLPVAHATVEYVK